MIARISNLSSAIAALAQFPDAIRRKWLRIAMNAGGGLLRRRLADQVSRKTGLLRASLGVKVNFIKSRPGEWHATVGARRKFRRSHPQVVVGLGIQVSKRGKIRAATRAQIRKAKASAFGQGAKQRVASRYAHLSEKKNPAFSRVSVTAGPEALHVSLGKILQGVETERQAAYLRSLT